MNTAHGLVHSFRSQMIKDAKDAPFLFAIARSLLILLPLAFEMFHSEQMIIWLALPYLALNVFFLGPHLLMLHNICHRNPWTKAFQSIGDFIVGFLGIFFGLPPHLYYFHHIKMHHKEGNTKRDLSSTEHYQRDSFKHWLIYFFRFVLLNPRDLTRYMKENGKKGDNWLVVITYTFFFGLILTLFIMNPLATTVVFIIPTLITRFGLMGGNWAQHAFVDQVEPHNDYKSSITIIDSLYNRRCFNDGYHIGHHLSPGRHWTDMPADFERNKEKYIENDSVVFRTIDYQMIWLLLMLKKYKTLAKYFVDLSGKKSEAEIIALLKSRLKPIV